MLTGSRNLRNRNVGAGTGRTMVVSTSMLMIVNIRNRGVAGVVVIDMSMVPATAKDAVNQHR